DKTVIESLLNETYLTIKATADSVKSMNNLIDLYKDVFTEQKMNIPSIVSTHVGSLNSYTSKTNSHLSNLLSQVNSIKNYKDSIFNNTRSLQEKNESLKNLKEGPDALDIESSKLSLTQKENALLDAKNNLSNYYVYAPFDGKIASVPVSKFDSISSGSAIATLITAQQQADISLNEIDASKIKLGQKATMTFDAIDELVITGTVSELDTVGTVSQGVVTYKASILFDIKDERIKSGMSVSASIVIDKKLDVLTIPNSAIKTSGNNNYVEILTGATSPASSGQGVISGTVPEQKNVVVGLSNDSITEVVSGLKEGDQIISRSIKPTTTTATPSITSLMGGNRAAGGTARATTGR
ncbi:MAG: efflux RND transporter periplasmic adaptor subunit, partial [bacterium]